MTPALEEARRLLRIAASDRDAFLVLKAASHVRLSIVCFHAQQSIEKALKAVLTANGVSFRRIHDLDELAQLLLSAGIHSPYSPDELALLNPHAVVFRYDDEDIETVSRDQAQAMVENVLSWAAGVLLQGLENQFDFTK